MKKKRRPVMGFKDKWGVVVVGFGVEVSMLREREREMNQSCKLYNMTL